MSSVFFYGLAGALRGPLQVVVRGQMQWCSGDHAILRITPSLLHAKPVHTQLNYLSGSGIFFLRKSLHINSLKINKWFFNWVIVRFFAQSLGSVQSWPLITAPPGARGAWSLSKDSLRACVTLSQEAKRVPGEWLSWELSTAVANVNRVLRGVLEKFHRIGKCLEGLKNFLLFLILLSSPALLRVGAVPKCVAWGSDSGH